MRAVGDALPTPQAFPQAKWSECSSCSAFSEFGSPEVLFIAFNDRRISWPKRSFELVSMSRRISSRSAAHSRPRGWAGRRRQRSARACHNLDEIVINLVALMALHRLSAFWRHR